MCEPVAHHRRGLSVRERQERTVASCLVLRRPVPSLAGGLRTPYPNQRRLIAKAPIGRIIFCRSLGEPLQLATLQLPVFLHCAVDRNQIPLATLSSRPTGHL